MNDENTVTWKEIVVTYIKLISQHLPGQSEENHDRFHSR
jgi:hypothetical protein